MDTRDVELNNACLSLGDARRSAEAAPPKAPRPRYEVRCMFCHCMHTGDFWDEIEAEIMSCRDLVPAYRRGLLEHHSESQVEMSYGP